MAGPVASLVPSPVGGTLVPGPEMVGVGVGRQGVGYSSPRSGGGVL